MASTTTPEPKWVLVYDWSEKTTSRIHLDGLREAAYQVFPIPRPSYMLVIYGLRMDLSDYRDFEEIHVINMPPSFSDTGHRSYTSTPTTSLSHRSYASTLITPFVIHPSYAPSSYQHSSETPYVTPSSAGPQASASSISSTSGLATSSTRLDSSTLSHDFHVSSTQTSSGSSGLSPNVLQAICKEIIQDCMYPAGSYDAVFAVRWELDQYLETELVFDPKNPEMDMFDSVLTITGTGCAAYATTARSYIQREWPGSRVCLLDHLRHWARGHCPYTSKSFILKSCNSVEGYALLSS